MYAILDVETTGLNARSERMTEIAIFIYDGKQIIDEGRNPQEKAAVKVQNGKYCGYGYISAEQAGNPELLNDCIHPYPDNKDVQVIIKGYLRRNKELQIMRIKETLHARSNTG
ncbi:MAG: hypothetical protein U9R60_06215 [Bacteroidota bacterium]|nr:hypothetical protein [Bacteroidota bacterium]